jgi:hypothetical protein
MNKMVVKVELLVGPISAILGGIIMLFSAYFVSETYIAIGYYISDAGLYWFEVGLYPELITLGFLCTILWGVMGIIGGIIAIFGKKSGSIIALMGGILGIIGALVPIGTNIAVTQIPTTFSGSIFLLDTILMIFGGILGLTSEN